MGYLLDTCIVIEILNGSDFIQGKVSEVGLDKCFTCDIVLAELFVGPFKTQNPRHLAQAQWVERRFVSLPFHESFKTYARIRAQLESKGQKLDNMDMLIASIAIDNDLTLATRNSKHFDRIPGLKIEVWGPV